MFLFELNEEFLNNLTNRSLDGKDTVIKLEYNKKKISLSILYFSLFYDSIVYYDLPNPIGTRVKIVITVLLCLFIKLKMYDISKEFMPKSSSNNIIVTKKKQEYIKFS